MLGEKDFNQIYKEYHSRIRNYLARLLGVQEAEDASQEVFAKIGRGLHSFKGESKLSTWIYRIATNTAVDKLRSASFKRATDHTTIEDTARTEHRITTTGQTNPSIDQKDIRKEMGECVREYIDRLPPDYRTVLVLSEIGEFKNREIADILEISLENVKVRLHRARVSLKKELHSGCDFYYNEDGVLACDRKSVVIGTKIPD